MKPRTLRFAISTLVSGLLLASIVSVGLAHYVGARRVLYLTTQEMMGQIAQSANDKLAQRLHTVEKVNTLIADLVRSGNLDLAQEDHLTDFLKDVLEANSSVAVISCGLPSGRLYQARRMPDGSISRRINRRADGIQDTFWVHQHPAYLKEFPAATRGPATGRDFRESRWWLAGLASGKRVWTEVYPTRRGLNYVNVNPSYDAAGRLRCMVAIDMSLGDLSVFLNRFKFGQGGKAFVLDRDGHVVAMAMASEACLEQIMKPAPAGSETGFVLRDSAELQDDDLRMAVQEFRKGSPDGGKRFLAFKGAGNRKLLAAFEPDPRYHFTFGVVLPEDSILGSIKRSLNQTLGLAGVFLVLALIVAAWISHSIAKPLTLLAREVDRIRTLDLGDGPAIRTSILEVVRIEEAIQNMRSALRSFRKYVPADLVVQLMALKKEAVIEGERLELTLFFSDIADFTSLSEQLAPESLLLMLESYFGDVTRILVEHSGTVDKFIGDAIMAFWGAPSPVANPAELACRAALQAQERIEAVNGQWRLEGRPSFHTRIGLHTGEATVGNVGYADRMNYTAIGDHVNLASRLEGLNKFYGTRILASATTVAAAGEVLLARTVDRVAVKGKDQAIAIYELLALRAEASPELLEAAARWEVAFDHYQHQRWEEALALFMALFMALPGPGDGPRAILIERCRAFQANPPGLGWDGVFRHHEK